MSITIGEARYLLESFSPAGYQCEWDNTGWNIVSGNDITGIYICLDVTSDIVNRAEKHGCNMILSHHPLFFNSVKSVDADDSIGGVACKIIKNDMSLYCAHTSVDEARWGLNIDLAERLGLKEIGFLESLEESHGSGFIGYTEPVELSDILCKIKDVIKTDSVRVSCSDMQRIINCVAGCTGAGSDLVGVAASRGADLFITGEIKHNVYVENNGMVLVEAGHYDTEKRFVHLAADYLQKKADELKYNLLIIRDMETLRPYFNY